MKVLREKEYPDGKFTLCFIGYGDEATNTVLELTYNWGRHASTRSATRSGTSPSARATSRARATRVRALGYKVTREPGPMKHGTTVIAFVEDPTGYKIELIERALTDSLGRRGAAWTVSAMGVLLDRTSLPPPDGDRRHDQELGARDGRAPR